MIPRTSAHSRKWLFFPLRITISGYSVVSIQGTVFRGQYSVFSIQYNYFAVGESDLQDFKDFFRRRRKGKTITIYKIHKISRAEGEQENK